MSIAVETSWHSILRDRETRPEVAGKLVYEDTSGQRVVLDARIKVRGRWRLENCNTPPFTLKLAGGQLAATAFAGQETIHVTPQCHREVKYQQHLLQEYLVFRMYGLLTDVSLRARLAEIEYRDPGARKASWTGHAVLVEDIGIAADRLGRRWIDSPRVAPKSLAPDAAALLALFQYMIGHTDWSTLQGPPGERCCHNAALLAPPDSDSDLAAVPYDFDASGLVDTGDIEPPDGLPIRSVRQRLYRGLCVHNPQVGAAVERLNSSRPELEALFDDAQLLSAKGRRRAHRYLEGSYEIFNDPAKLESKILSRCR